MSLQKNFLSALSYLFCGLILVYVFFVQTFPNKELEKRLEYESQDLVGERIDVQDMTFVLPFGLGCEIVKTAGSQVELRDVRFRFKLIPLISKRILTELSFKTLDGEAEGELEIFPVSSLKNVDLELNWQSLRLDRLPLIARLKGVKRFSGTCPGKLELNLNRNEPLLARGQGEVLLRDGVAGLSIPGIQELDFEEIQGRGTWTLKEKTLKVTGLNFQARGVQGRCSGTIALREDVAQSGLHLQGDLQFTPAQPTTYSLVKKHLGKTSFDFSLLGDLARPRCRLNS